MYDVENKNILITGGTGFVGKNIVPLLEKEGANVTATGRDYDLSVFSESEKLFTLKKYDLIIHAAAFQGAGDFPLRYPADQFMINNLIHTHALHMWKEHQSQATFVGIGSTCSYPGNLAVLREEDYFTGPLHESVETYGLTKCVLQKGIEAYKKQYGLKGTTVVFATLYGPHDEFDLEKSHVVSALVKKFCDAKQFDLPEVEIWGDGTQTRELIYVEDQIKGLLATCEYEGDLINIGTGIETTIRDLAETISNLTGFAGSIIYNTDKFVGVKRKVLDVSKAESLYGWTTKEGYVLIPLEDGLERTITWYRRNYLEK
jgi:GDP-L-fucose synthase